MSENLPNDQLQHVTEISSDLKDALETSRASVDKIDELLKRIAYYSVTDVDDNGVPVRQEFEEEVEEEEVEEGDNELIKLERVKNENLQLLLDIQREEYIGRKWDNVLMQNEEILKSLVDWVKLNSNLSNIEIDEKSYLKKIQLSINNLDTDEEVCRLHIRSLVVLITELLEILENTIDNKEKITETRNAIVKEIKNLQKIYYSNKLN